MSELRKVQKNVMRMVENGEITKEEGMVIILNKGLAMLEDALRGKEDQSWERQEHPEFFSEVN